jgi:hypothetical protein
MIRVLSIVALLVSPLAVIADDKPVTAKLSGLSATVPAGWKSEKPANLLRSYQFKLPTTDQDHADAEVVVFPQSSADITKNFDNWKSQYIPPDGKAAADVTKTSEFDVVGAKAHVLDVSGTWKYKERPKDPTSKEVLRPEFRTVWVVLVAKEETTHIRLSGHQSVIEKHYDDFEKWVKSLK